MRLIEVTFPDGEKVQPILKATLKTNPLDHRLTEPDNQGKRLLRLTFRDGDGQKAIDAVQAILEGRQPADLSLEKLLRTDIPLDWDRQVAVLGFTDVI